MRTTHLHHNNMTRPACARRGTVMVLVVGAITITMLAAMAFMVGASPLYAYAEHTESKSHARLLAESAVDHVLAQVVLNPQWFEECMDETWESSIEFEGTPVSVRVGRVEDEHDTIEVPNASFELQTGSLANPLFNPPMSGFLGGWALKRTAIAGTGLTVPRVGVRSSASATEGDQHAHITFVASLIASGSFSRELVGELEPNASYAVLVDIGATSLPVLEDNAWFELYAGSTLLISSRQACVLADLGDVGELLEKALDALDSAIYPCVLLRTLLDTSTATCELRFQTDDEPPTDTLRIELHAESLGLLSEVTFDNIRILRTDIPFTVSAFAEHGRADHALEVSARRDWTGDCTIIGWREP